MYLSKDYKVITYARRGYGHNDQVVDHSLESQIDDIKKNIDSIHGNVKIIAHSAGAILALEYALYYPDTIDQCFLYESVYSKFVQKDESYLQTLQEVEK